MVGKPEGKSSLSRARLRWLGNIKMDLSELGWGGKYLIDLAEVMNQ
jgi:hypothetical protein